MSHVRRVAKRGGFVENPITGQRVRPGRPRRIAVQDAPDGRRGRSLMKEPPKTSTWRDLPVGKRDVADPGFRRPQTLRPVLPSDERPPTSHFLDMERLTYEHPGLAASQSSPEFIRGASGAGTQRSPPRFDAPPRRARPAMDGLAEARHPALTTPYARVRDPTKLQLNVHGSLPDIKLSRGRAEVWPDRRAG